MISQRVPHLCVFRYYCPLGCTGPIPCVNGKYSDGSAGECSPCPAGLCNTPNLLSLTLMCYENWLEAGAWEKGYEPLVTRHCAPGKYGDGSGGCSPCILGAGYGCPPGSTQLEGVPCSLGTYYDPLVALGISSSVLSSFCIPCPVGRFGDATGLASASCSGVCVAPPGSGCPAGETSPTGTLCTPGRFGLGGSADCEDCPFGTYGNSAGLADPSCTGECVSVAGYVCLSGSTNNTGAPCPAGYTSVVGGIECTLCPPGRYSPAPGSPECMVCPVGRYGIGGSTSALCLSTCQYTPGYVAAQPDLES
jgi:hypothetical protein